MLSAFARRRRRHALSLCGHRGNGSPPFFALSAAVTRTRTPITVCCARGGPAGLLVASGGMQDRLPRKPHTHLRRVHEPGEQLVCLRHHRQIAERAGPTRPMLASAMVCRQVQALAPSGAKQTRRRTPPAVDQDAAPVGELVLRAPRQLPGAAVFLRGPLPSTVNLTIASLLG